MADVYERAWQARGMTVVAGVDEVGRGPLAGPVMTAAVVVPECMATRAKLMAVVRDSKQLAPKKRPDIAALVRDLCRVSVGMAEVAEIDALNIRQATLLAMRRAVAGLGENPHAILVDGLDVPKGLVGEAVVKGDGRELCIACASVVAKVERDALMARLALDFPHYGWESNAGYGTAGHMAGLESHGVTVHHRTSFAPIRLYMQKVA
jgi:ribonuclease HII